MNNKINNNQRSGIIIIFLLNLFLLFTHVALFLQFTLMPMTAKNTSTLTEKMLALLTKNQIPESDTYYLVESAFEECFFDYDG